MRCQVNATLGTRCRADGCENPDYGESVTSQRHTDLHAQRWHTPRQRPKKSEQFKSLASLFGNHGPRYLRHPVSAP
jgi:hypothetical protein